MNNPAEKTKALLLSILLVLTTTGIVRAQSPEVINLMRTMPRDHSLYMYMNVQTLFDDENTFGLSSPEILEELQKIKEIIISSRVESVPGYENFDRFMFEKLNRRELGHVLFGGSESPSNNPIVDFRLYTNVTASELASVYKPEDGTPFAIGSEYQIPDGNGGFAYMGLLDDYYFGFSDKPGKLKVDHVEAPSDAAKSFGAIMTANPVITIVGDSRNDAISKAESLDFVKSLSLTLLATKPQPTVNILIEIKDPGKIESTLEITKRIHRNARNSLINRRDQIARMPNFRQTPAYTEFRGLNNLIDLIGKVEISAKSTNLHVSIPLDLEFMKDPEFIRGFRAGVDRAMKENELIP